MTSLALSSNEDETKESSLNLNVDVTKTMFPLLLRDLRVVTLYGDSSDGLGPYIGRESLLDNIRQSRFGGLV